MTVVRSDAQRGPPCLRCGKPIHAFTPSPIGRPLCASCIDDTKRDQPAATTGLLDARRVKVSDDVTAVHVTHGTRVLAYLSWNAAEQLGRALLVAAEQVRDDEDEQADLREYGRAF